MTLCQHRLLDDPAGARCTSEEHPRNPGGHVYDGDNVPDRHDTSEAAAEGTRG